MTSDLRVEMLDKKNEFEWELFVRRNVPEIFFSLEWRELLRSTFNYADCYFLIKNGDETIGIFPSFLVRSLFFGSRIISLPFCDYGGICFALGIAEEIRKEAEVLIFDDLRSFGRKHGAGYVEIRGGLLRMNNGETGLLVARPYCTFQIPLYPQPWGKIWGNFSRNIRRILKRDDSAVTFAELNKNPDFEQIYRIYLADIKKFGSPPLPRSYFQKEWALFAHKGMFKVFIASERNRIIGALTVLTSGGKVHAEHIMSVPRNNKHVKINLYHRSMVWAYEQGKLTYDFCRTRKNSGVYHHKKRWGGQEQPIHYSYLTVRGKRIFELDYGHRAFFAPKILLKRVPSCIARKYGPGLRRMIGK